MVMYAGSRSIEVKMDTTLNETIASPSTTVSSFILWRKLGVVLTIGGELSVNGFRVSAIPMLSILGNPYNRVIGF